VARNEPAVAAVQKKGRKYERETERERGTWRQNERMGTHFARGKREERERNGTRK